MRLFCFSLGPMVIGLLLGSNVFCQDLVPYRKNALWGYADPNRNLVIQPQFDDAEFFKDGLARVKKNGKVWLIDAKGELKTPNGYEAIFDFHNGLAAACRGGKYSWTQGEIVGGQWGYINEKFEEVIPFVYARAEDFNGDYAIVQEKDNWGSWGVIDKVGRVALPFKYPSYSFDMRPFPGLRWHNVPGQLQAGVGNSGNKWKIINLKGQQVAPPKEGLHGLYPENEDAEYKARMKAADAKTAELKKHNGMLHPPSGPVRTNGSAWCVAKGLYLTTMIGDDGSETKGLFNEKNEIVIPFEFEQIASTVNENMISVRKKGKWGFYSTEGKQAVECRYDFVSHFKNGLCFVSHNNGKRQFGGYIDRNGHEFFETDPAFKVIRKNNKVTLADEFENEIALEGSPKINDASIIGPQHVMVDLEKSMAVYNREGKKIIEAPIILKLRESRIITEGGTVSQVVDVKTGKVLADSLVPENDYKYNRNVTSKGYRVYKQFPKKLYGVVSSAGETAIPFEYSDITHNGDYFILKNEKGQYAIVDTLNRIVKPFSNDAISTLTPRLFRVYITAKKYYEVFDARTKTLTNYHLQDFKDQTGTWVISNTGKKFGIILKANDQLVEPVYTSYTTTTFPNENGNGVRFVVMTKSDRTMDLYNAETSTLVIPGAEATSNYDFPMFAVKTKGKFMFYNTDGKLLSDKTYDDVRNIHSSAYVAVKSGGKWGVINKKFQTILDFDYTSVTSCNGYYFVAATDYSYGVISVTKKIVIPFQYDYITHIGQYETGKADEFPVQVYQVDKEEKSALLNHDQKQLTPFELEGVADVLSNGFIINKNGSPCFYTFDGKCLIEPGFDAIEPFDVTDTEGRDLLRVRKGKKYGLYNDRGKMLLACEYNEFYGGDEYYHGQVMYNIIEKDGKKGMFGNDGKIAIPVMYSSLDVQMLDDDAFIKVNRDGKTGLYKNYTRKLVEAEYDDITLYEDNLYAYYIPVKKEGYWGVMDTSGKIVAQPSYTSLRLEEMDEGYVLMTQYRKGKGMLRTNGEVVLRPEFSSIEPVYDFNKTTYLVQMGKTYGLFDAGGKMIVPCNAYKVENRDDYPMVFFMQDGKLIGVTSDLEAVELKE